MGYLSDLKDEEWELISHHFATGKYGNRAVHSRRSLVNGILYMVKTGCQWRMLPKDFPPRETVYGYFRRLSLLGIWEKVLADLVAKKRARQGRNEYPSLLIIDAQSIRTAGKGQQRGFDGGKKPRAAKGRSRLTCRETCTRSWFIRLIRMTRKAAPYSRTSFYASAIE